MTTDLDTSNLDRLRFLADLAGNTGSARVAGYQAEEAHMLGCDAEICAALVAVEVARRNAQELALTRITEAQA